MQLNNYYHHHMGPLLDTEQDLITGLSEFNKFSTVQPNLTVAAMQNELPHLQWWNETYPLHADFNYQHNEWGFRSGTVVRDCAVSFYGCSMTWGHGIPETTRWTNLVAGQHGLTFNNFGVPGIGADAMLDIFWATSQHVKMRTAVFMLNGQYRPRVVLGNGQVIEYHSLTPRTSLGNGAIQIRDLVYYRDQLFQLPDEYFEHVNTQAIIKIHKLCKLMNVRAIFTTYLDPCHDQLLAIQKQLPIEVTASPLTVLDGDSKDSQHALARDRSHLGMEANQKLALLFKDLF